MAGFEEEGVILCDTHCRQKEKQAYCYELFAFNPISNTYMLVPNVDERTHKQSYLPEIECSSDDRHSFLTLWK